MENYDYFFSPGYRDIKIEFYSLIEIQTGLAGPSPSKAVTLVQQEAGTGSSGSTTVGSSVYGNTGCWKGLNLDRI